MLLNANLTPLEKIILFPWLQICSHTPRGRRFSTDHKSLTIRINRAITILASAEIQRPPRMWGKGSSTDLNINRHEKPGWTQLIRPSYSKGSSIDRNSSLHGWRLAHMGFFAGYKLIGRSIISVVVFFSKFPRFEYVGIYMWRFVPWLKGENGKKEKWLFASWMSQLMRESF